MDIFMKSNDLDCNISNIPPNQYAVPLVMLPYISVPNQPFSDFSLVSLDQDTTFNILLHNRKLCFYGQSPYSYNGVRHHPKPLPASENYLNLLLEHLKSVLPDFEYNSILLTKYENGSDSIGFHCDNEPEIKPNSDIVTISLGQSRTAKFRTVSAICDYPEQELTLHHGDVVVMSRNSQDFFKHAIVPDDSCNPRISVTLRMLRTYDSQDHLLAPIVPDNVNQVQTSSHRVQPNEQSKTLTLYIGDSMLKHLDSKKMSSSSQNAHVFSYPGATAGSILSKLKSDPLFLKLDPSLVTKIYVLCGANSVDKVLNIPFSMNSNFIDNGYYQISEKNLHHAKIELSQLADFLHNWSHPAFISYINILPRESSIRNQVINCLNQHTKMLTYDKPFLNIVSTELHRNLFTYQDGYRKNDFFSQQGQDNVHLTATGIIRLARYLKYSAHN